LDRQGRASTLDSPAAVVVAFLTSLPTGFVTGMIRPSSAAGVPARTVALLAPVDTAR
jgi:hypothetical protein